MSPRAPAGEGVVSSPGHPVAEGAAARPSGRWTLRGLVLLGVLPLGAVLLDLFLGFELPGVLWLEHGLFAATQGLFDLLIADDVRRSPALWLLLAVGPVTWFAHRPAFRHWATAIQILLLGAVCAVALALLLTRPGLGLAGLAVLAILGLRARASAETPARAAFVLAAVALAAVALYRLLLGHHGGLLPGLRDLPHPQGHGAPDPDALATAFTFAAGLLCVLGIGAWLRSRPDRTALLQLAAATALGAAAILLVGEPDQLLGLALLPAFAAAARAGWLGGPVRWRLASTSSLALAWGLACLAHAEVFGAWACPDPAAQNTAGLHRLGDAAKTFRAVRAPGGELLLVHRRDGFITRWADTGTTVLDPGVASGPAGVAGPRFSGAPEELVAAPELGRWFGTLDAHGPLRARLGPEGAIWSAPFGGAVDQVHAIPGCWTNALAWDAPRQRLLITCENAAEVLVWDAAGQRVTERIELPGVGDVVDLRWDGEAFWAASLWFSPWITRLGAETLQPVDRRFVGGGAYRVEPAGDRQLVTRFYGSRVAVVGPGGRRALRTGLGTRALAVDPGRRLVLASSQFDGRLRVFDLDSGESLLSLPVGGDVKDIAYDPVRGLASFAGLCGLFEWDADRFARSRRTRETR